MVKKIGIVIFAMATVALGGCNKMTGGGWLVDDLTGNLVNFGFNAQPVGEPDGDCPLDPFGGSSAPCWEAKGRLNIVDHGNVDGQRAHWKGDFTGTYTGQSPLECSTDSPCASEFRGTATMGGHDYVFRMRITDYGEGRGDYEVAEVEGDYLEVFFTPVDGGAPIGYVGFIGGGNFQVHKK